MSVVRRKPKLEAFKRVLDTMFSSGKAELCEFRVGAEKNGYNWALGSYERTFLPAAKVFVCAALLVKLEHADFPADEAAGVGIMEIIVKQLRLCLVAENDADPCKNLQRMACGQIWSQLLEALEYIWDCKI